MDGLNGSTAGLPATSGAADDRAASPKLIIQMPCFNEAGTLSRALADLPTRDESDRVRGIGLNYAQVVQVLAALCRDGTIPARLVLERTSLTELLGPAPSPERRETDEPAWPPETVEPEPDSPPAESEADWEVERP